MSESIPLFQVDSFTDKAFAGNPAGVCLPGGPVPERWMQDVAEEMNLSETAFLYEEKGVWTIRYFTPEIEVPLCGHATLASAHILWREGIVPSGETIELRAPAGELRATQEGDAIRMDFPAIPTTPGMVARGDRRRARHRTARRVSRGRRRRSSSTRRERAVRDLRPDFTLLKKGNFRPAHRHRREQRPPLRFRLALLSRPASASTKIP